MADTPEESPIDSLKEENRQLLRDVKIIEKLLESYRKCLLIFNINCCCDKNTENKPKVESLEQYYCQYIGSNTKSEDKAVNCSQNFDICNKTNIFGDVLNDEFFIKLEKKQLKSDESIDEDSISDKNQDSYVSSEEESPEKDPKVLTTENGEQKKFVCRFESCGQSFDDNYNLKRHVMGCHTFEYPFECQNCDKSFCRSDHLVKHVNRRHKNYKKYVCTHEDCDFETIFENKYNLHELRHKIVCIECRKTFPTNNELKVHKQKEHKIVSKVTTTAKRGSKSGKDLVKTENNDEEYDKNQSQDADSEEESKIRSKKRRTISANKHKSKQKKLEVIPKEIICPEVGCGRQFKCMQNLRKHTKTVHLNLRPYPCDWPGCESAFKTREAMTNHKSIHSNERNFKCQFEGCNKSFKIRCKLTQHLRCHGIGPKNERFPCSWPACGQFCASEQALTEHLNRHQNIRPFVCQFSGCDKTYFTSFELRQHSMKFHEQNESFRCDYKDCAMSYLNKRDLAKHRRLHIDVAKFVCSWPECCHTFNTSRDLSDHMNRHMDIKANKCLFLGCDRSYFTKKDLMRHVKQSHS